MSTGFPAHSPCPSSRHRFLETGQRETRAGRGLWERETVKRGGAFLGETLPRLSLREPEWTPRGTEPALEGSPVRSGVRWKASGHQLWEMICAQGLMSAWSWHLAPELGEHGEERITSHFCPSQAGPLLPLAPQLSGQSPQVTPWAPQASETPS